MFPNIQALDKFRVKVGLKPIRRQTLINNWVTSDCTKNKNLIKGKFKENQQLDIQLQLQGRKPI